MELKPEQINPVIELHDDCDGFENSTKSQKVQPEEDKFVDDLARALIFIARSIT